MTTTRRAGLFPLLLVACGAMAGVVFAGGDASAYVTRTTTSGLPVRWPTATVTFAIDARFDDVIPGGVAAVEAALESWSGVGSAPTIVEKVGIGDAVPAYDGKNIVYFAADGYGPAGDALAVTALSFDEVSGDIVDADIVVNGVYAFAILAAGEQHAVDAVPMAMEGGEGAAVTAGPFDIGHVAAHETGHSLGLRDEPTDTTALMYPYTFAGQSSGRAPSSDDAAGMTVLYHAMPAASQASGCASASIVAASPSRSPWSPALFFAAGAVVLGAHRLRRRR